MPSAKSTTLVFVFLHLLTRTDAAWTYDDKPIMEGPMNALEVLVTKVTSDNKTTVIYDIAGDYAGKFRVDQSSGHIYQVKPLDRETKSEYMITASAADAAGNPSEKPISFRVIVLDINDNSPVFNKSTLFGRIQENHPIGLDSFPFMRVAAMDADEGFNGKVVYSLLANSDSPPSLSGDRFAIDPETGDVRLLGHLNYEIDPVVRFNVQATDGGGQPNRITKKTTSQVTVYVKDSNDRAPKFGPLKIKTLSEASQVGQPFYKIEATDEDYGVNKKVYFEITSGNTRETFGITSKPSDTDKSVGQLYLLKELDFENGVNNYALTIRAFNREATNADDLNYSTIETLNITILDANEPPVFRNTPYSTIIGEWTDPSEPIPIIRVFAEDMDFGGNQTVTYSLDNAKPGFDIDSTSGIIMVVGAVDREAEYVINGIYQLQVVATDNYGNGQHAHAIATVDIVINDINDNAPMPDWGRKSEITVCEKPTNKTIAVIKAIDQDSAQNGPTFSFRFNDSVDTSLWKFNPIDNESQSIVATYSDYDLEYPSQKVDLVFTITDSGVLPQTGTATLAVWICKCNERGESNCNGIHKAELPLPVILAITAIILTICVVGLVIAACKSESYSIKEEEESDATQSLQEYQVENCEMDNRTYDLTSLLGQLEAIRKYPGTPCFPIPCNVGIPFPDQCVSMEVEDSFDSIICFNYEGSGSDAGSLSSIDSDTTDESTNTAYLKDWGPKFKYLDSIYNSEMQS